MDLSVEQDLSMADESRADQVDDLNIRLAEIGDMLKDLTEDLDGLRDDLITDEGERIGNSRLRSASVTSDEPVEIAGVETELYGRISEQGARELWAALTSKTVMEVNYSPSWQEIVSSVAVFAAEARDLGNWRKKLREKDDEIRRLTRQQAITKADRERMFAQANHWFTTAQRLALGIDTVEKWLADLQRILDRDRHGAVSVHSVRRVHTKLAAWCSEARRVEQELINGEDVDEDESSLPLEYERD